ncbi:MAG: hypothetical protein EP297_14570 [Gammaproteobacteria bacterium]|nr:MAG: hypothetical protein EP297_14570 [Gammaproteobacteria bacterium]
MIPNIRINTGIAFGAVALLLSGCAKEKAVDISAILSQPKAYVGSEVCKTCHLEHYDAWKMTLHSRMTQDAKRNADVIIGTFDEKKIRADLEAKHAKKPLKVPPDEIYIPKRDEVLITIGSQWKQRYIIKKEGELLISPVQYNSDSDTYVNYHEHDWKKRPWLKKCGGCHATGVDPVKKTYVELGVGCESCHGKGSWHVALPKTAIHEKRDTIINTAKLTLGVAAEICGSCHNRGKSTQLKGSNWAVGYEPGKALEVYYKSVSYKGGNKKKVYANEFAKGHHQQYIDWKQSKHFKEGVTCVSCHYAHELGAEPVRAQTRGGKGSKMCLECHVQTNKVGAHAIHSFANCLGCHMPRIAKSAEAGDIRSHVFVTLLPKDTLENPKISNSCQTCHEHKDQDLKELQERYEALSKRVPKTAAESSSEDSGEG